MDSGVSEVSMRDVTEVHKLSNTEFLADTGLPHLVVFSNNIQEIDVFNEGR